MSQFWRLRFGQRSSSVKWLPWSYWRYDICCSTDDGSSISRFQTYFGSLLLHICVRFKAGWLVPVWHHRLSHTCGPRLWPGHTISQAFRVSVDVKHNVYWTHNGSIHARSCFCDFQTSLLTNRTKNRVNIFCSIPIETRPVILMTLMLNVLRCHLTY